MSSGFLPIFAYLDRYPLLSTVFSQFCTLISYISFSFSSLSILCLYLASFPLFYILHLCVFKCTNFLPQYPSAFLFFFAPFTISVAPFPSIASSYIWKCHFARNANSLHWTVNAAFHCCNNFSVSCARHKANKLFISVQTFINISNKSYRPNRDLNITINPIPSHDSVEIMHAFHDHKWR